MRRLAATAAVLCAGVAALALTGASSGGGGGKRYELVFDNAFGLVPGGDLKVGGVRAGRLTGFRLSPDRPPKAVVEVEVTEPGMADFRRDASCEVKPQSLIGEYFVDCQPGSSAKPLAGARVPVERTSTGVPVDLINNVLRRPYRERLRLLLSELGAGLAGRPEDLSEVIRRAHPGLRETNRVLRVLGGQNRAIRSFIRDADTIVAELEARKADVARFVTEAGETAEVSATRRAELRGTLRRLPGFLDELRPTMARLGELADEQVPLLTDLERAAPELDRFLARLGPFARASRPALRSLGAAGSVGARAFRKGRRELAELRRLSRDAPPTARPLRQFLQTLDDRRRAHAEDPRARASAPPAPDPTAIPAGEQGGFTGLEAIANYPFWQGLSINRLDEIGHSLVIVGVLNDCVEYQTGPIDDSNRGLFERCHQWLGPYQPGVNADDPTKANGSSAPDAARSGRTRPRRRGERRGAGEPEAVPVPGQRDISRPRVVLPPALRDLADVPTPPKVAPRRPRGPAIDRLLDFLLAP